MKKIIPKDYQKKLKTRPKSGIQHEQRELIVQGKEGHTFTIVLRKNKIDFLDFSVILRYKKENTGIWYNLVSYAKITKTYKTFNEAIESFFKDFNFHVELLESATTLKEFGGG